MRIFIGPTEIAGIGSSLRDGFVGLGLHCDVVTATPHRFSYGAENGQSILIRAWQWVSTKIRNSRSSRFKKLPLYLARFALRWAVVAKCLCSYDVFIFVSGLTLTDSELELRLLRAFKKKVIFWYVGSDARPPYMSGGKFQPPFCADVGDKVYFETRKVARLISLHEKYAQAIITSPTIAQFNTRRLVNWFAVGIPRIIPEHFGNKKNASKSSLRALHSPSKPVLKGTSLIKQAVSNLNTKGVNIELILIEGMPNSVVLDEIAKCDFVIDQMYSDQPLATFAVEAAHFGKPAVVGGYFAEVIESYLNPEFVGPSEFVTPANLEMAIERLATDQSYRMELGSRAKQFVDDRWTSRAVAERFVKILSGTAPEEWYFDPRDTTYTDGCGLSRESTAVLIREVVGRHGASALMVDDKPELKAALVSMAQKYAG